MKLKYLVASLVAAGVVSAPAFAAVGGKHGNTAHHKHRGVVTTRPLLHDATTSEYLIEYNNAHAHLSARNWTRRISVGGEINVDFRYGSRGPLGISPVFMISDDSHELNVNNANLYFDAAISQCVKAHLGLAYVQDSVNNWDTNFRTLSGFSSITKQVRGDRSSVWAGGEVSVDEAYFTIHDFSQSPVFFRAGKYYTPFGHYAHPYPISYSYAQLLSQLRATTVELGGVSSYGLYGSVYVLDGQQSALSFSDRKEQMEHAGPEGPEGPAGSMNGKSGHYADSFRYELPYTRINNYGVEAGYHGTFHCIDYHLNGGWIKDIRDVNYLADIQDLVAYTFSGEHLSDVNGFGMRQTNGVHVHGDATYGAVVVSVDYVSALSNVIRRYHSDDSVSGTRIWASDISGTYNCNLWGYDTVWHLSYQRTGDAAGILPQTRYQGDVSFELMPHTHVTFEYRFDSDYDTPFEDHFARHLNNIAGGAPNAVLGGTGRSYNQATLRLGVVF